MGYYCPNCGHPVDGNIFFQIAGQCMCGQCGEILELIKSTRKGTAKLLLYY